MFYRYTVMFYRRIKYNFKENFSLLERIRQISIFDWKLIQTVKYEDYIWWSYPNFKQNEKFESFSDKLDLKPNNGIPKCIIKIVQLINGVTFFNKQIKQFVCALTWS